MKGFLQDKNGNLSSMRLSFLICTMLSSVLTIVSLIALFYDKEISQLLNTAIAFMTIATTGKTISKKFEGENND